VTFTNKAAREMRGRIEHMLQIPTHGMWVGTFHGLAHRLLKTHWQEARLPQNFQILDSDDQLRLVKRVCRELQLDESRWPPKQAQWYINAQKDEGLRAAHIEPPLGDLYIKTMLRVYAAYEAACERGGMVDFAELLLRAHELWLQSPQVLAHYQGRFRQILVDEFQDTNTIQYAWLRVLAGRRFPSWRSATTTSRSTAGAARRSRTSSASARISRHPRRAPGAELPLDADHPAGRQRVIAHNSGRLGKELWSAGETASRCSCTPGFNEQDEARFIVEQIEAGSTTGTRALRGHSLPLQRAVAGARGGTAAQRPALSHLRWPALLRAPRDPQCHGLSAPAVSRGDDAAIERVINTPPRGIGSKTLDTLRERRASASARCGRPWQCVPGAQAAAGAGAHGARGLPGAGGRAGHGLPTR
jgi:DNA helicase-2/ATP-dependent DNA helicase PcrA